VPSDSRTSPPVTGPRVPPVAPGTRPELAELEARIRGARGRLSPLYQVLLNSPALAAGWEHLFTVIRQQSSVPPALRELVILRIAVLNGAHYEFEAHVPHALQAGMTQEAIDGLRKNTHVFDGVEKLVVQYTDAMTRELQVPDTLFEDLKRQFDDKTLVELTATIAGYNMVSRFLVAMRIR
jgi:4-carboxymuconolactone decarboxylase